MDRFSNTKRHEYSETQWIQYILHVVPEFSWLLSLVLLGWGLLKCLLEKKFIKDKKFEDIFLLALTLKFIYFGKATKFCKISTADLSYVEMVKSTVERSQNFVAFSEYMSFKPLFTTTFKPKMSISWLDIFSPLIEWVLAGVTPSPNY